MLRDFQYFFYWKNKNSTLAPYEHIEQEKIVLRISSRKFAKSIGLRSLWLVRWLRRHLVSAWLLTRQTPCRRSCWLWCHRIRIVVDLADTTMTTQTLSENFEGFSQILKKQWEKNEFVSVYTPKSKNLKILKTQKKKLRVPVVIDYAVGWSDFFTFKIRLIQ